MASWKSKIPANTKLQSALPARFLLGMATFLVFLSGCAIVGPGAVRPDVPTLSQQYHAQEFQQHPSIGLDGWWQSFADPTLDQLVSQALQNNLTVQVAAERIIEARANLASHTGCKCLKRRSNARQFVTPTRNPFQLFTPGVDSIWEIKLFGRLERAIQASEAELTSQEYSLQDVQQTLVADVATSYLSIRLLQNQVQTVDHSMILQEETNRVVSERADAGEATRLDAEQALAFLHRSRADKAILELQLDSEFNRLSILLGESPASMIREIVGIGPIPDAPYIPEAGIPIDFIRRRPDIRQAEAEIGAVTAGRIRDNIEVHESRLRQAATSYRSTVLSAVKEVEDARTKYAGYRKQSAELQNALRSDTTAVELSLQRFELGKNSFDRVLDSQLQLLQDSQASATARANANIQLIRLYRAIGGGWSGHAGGQNTLACTGCTAGHVDVGWSDNQTLQHGIVDGGIVSQDPNMAVVQEHSNIFASDVGTTTIEAPQGGVDSNLGETPDFREGKTILRLDETLPSTSASPPKDFAPIEFIPDLGQSQPQGVSPVVNHGMSKELFDWNEHDTAVVKAMRQIQKPVQGVANSNYFVESPEQMNNQSTQKASANQPSATEWISETVNDN